MFFDNYGSNVHCIQDKMYVRVFDSCKFQLTKLLSGMASTGLKTCLNQLRPRDSARTPLGSLQRSPDSWWWGGGSPPLPKHPTSTSAFQTSLPPLQNTPTPKINHSTGPHK